MNRKQFITTSLLSAGGIINSLNTFSAHSYKNIIGAGDRLGMALVGTGRRGREVMQAMIKTGRCEVRALCDVWDVQRQRAKDQLGLKNVFETNLLEEVLQRTDIDAVLIATPDHLHKDYSLAVLNSGRHLYLEKPVTLHFVEGEEIETAVKRSGKICQTGTQQRSGSIYKQVREEYFSGNDKLGDVVFVRALWSDFPWQRRLIGPKPRPEGFDWDRFLGSAPKIPYEWARYDGWRNYREYGAGILADLLNHWADVAQWMMDDPYPVSAVTSGGIYFLNDGRSNPDTVNSILQYKSWNLMFECSIMPIKNERSMVLFHGTKGKLELFREGYIYTPHNGSPVHIENNKDINTEHVTNFFDSIKENRAPSADIKTALQGVNATHLAVEAYWSGKRVGYSNDRKKIIELT